jgi:hypothetical protein
MCSYRKSGESRERRDWTRSTRSLYEALAWSRDERRGSLNLNVKNQYTLTLSALTKAYANQQDLEADRFATNKPFSGLQ